MRRALFAVVLVAASSLVACGDDGKPDRTIAILRVVPIPAANEAAFLAELDTAGWSKGDNLTLLDPDPSETHDDPADAEKTVRGWVDRGADLIVALSTPSAMAATSAGSGVDIVTLANDPVASGLVKDGDRPEGSLTGVAYRTPPDRTLDVAGRITPGVKTVGVLWPSDDLAAKPVRDALVDAAPSALVDVIEESFSGSADVSRAIDDLAMRGAQVVIVVNAAATVQAYTQIESSLEEHHLPSVANIVTATFATVVLAPDPIAAYRQLGRQAARLLDDTAVADVPIEDPGEFHLTVRTARADRLGIELSTELVGQADEIDGTS